MFQILIIFFSFSYSFANETGIVDANGNDSGELYSEKDFKRDLYSAYRDEDAREIWKWGLGTTAVLIALKEQVVLPVQDEISENEPLGEFSIYGDYAGQLVPNILYFGYQYWLSDHSQGKRQGILMLKTSAFAGMTTFFLKRLINEKRPSGSDRNSMPSGHTTTAFAFASVVALEHPNWAIPAYSLASFVGLSRINDNAHYLHNVTMGATIGMAYGYALYNLDQTKNSLSKGLHVFPINDGFIAGFTRRF